MCRLVVKALSSGWQSCIDFAKFYIIINSERGMNTFLHLMWYDLNSSSVNFFSLKMRIDSLLINAYSAYRFIRSVPSFMSFYPLVVYPTLLNNVLFDFTQNTLLQGKMYCIGLYCIGHKMSGKIFVLKFSQQSLVCIDFLEDFCLNTVDSLSRTSLYLELKSRSLCVSCNPFFSLYLELSISNKFSGQLYVYQINENLLIYL